MVDKINEFGWRSRFSCQNRDVREGMKYGKPVMPAVPIICGIEYSIPHNFCILLVSKRINKTSTIQQGETNKQCPNTHSFINIEESFPTKSVKAIPATVGTAGITGLPYFIPSRVMLSSIDLHRS